MTFSTHTFYEVAWRNEPLGSVWYVSDPFGEIESAKHYASQRTSQGYVTELWQIEKTKQPLDIEFHCDHEYHPLARLPNGWKDVCVNCGDYRIAHASEAREPERIAAIEKR